MCVCVCVKNPLAQSFENFVAHTCMLVLGVGIYVLVWALRGFGPPRAMLKFEFLCVSVCFCLCLCLCQTDRQIHTDKPTEETALE